MKLYTSLGPNPRSVRMFAAEKGIALDLQEIDIVGGECRREPYLTINPLGATPALVLDSGEVFTEILPICEYLEELSPAPSLIGSTPQQRLGTRMWARRIDLGFASPITLGFRADEGRQMFEPRVPVVRRDAASDLKGMAWSTLDWIERHHAGREYVAGDAFTLADILLFCFVDFCQMVGYAPLENREWLSTWFARVNARPSARA